MDDDDDDDDDIKRKHPPSPPAKRPKSLSVIGSSPGANNNINLIVGPNFNASLMELDN